MCINSPTWSWAISLIYTQQSQSRFPGKERKGETPGRQRELLTASSHTRAVSHGHCLWDMGEPHQVLITFHSLCWGLQLMGNLEYLQTKKRVGKMKGAPCSAPRGSPGDEGQLPTAPGRALGLAAGRRRDRMTDFNLIRHKGHWPGALPRSPLSPAFSISAAAAPGPGTDGQQSTVQRAGRARLCLCLQHSQPDKGQTVPGKGNDPVCDGAQPGTGGSAPERRQQRTGERRSSSGAGSAASPPEQSRASDRAPVLVTSHPGSPERLLCSCSRARLTANVGA